MADRAAAKSRKTRECHTNLDILMTLHISLGCAITFMYKRIIFATYIKEKDFR